MSTVFCLGPQFPLRTEDFIVVLGSENCSLHDKNEPYFSEGGFFQSTNSKQNALCFRELVPLKLCAALDWDKLNNVRCIYTLGKQIIKLNSQRKSPEGSWAYSGYPKAIASTAKIPKFDVLQLLIWIAKLSLNTLLQTPEVELLSG